MNERSMVMGNERGLARSPVAARSDDAARPGSMRAAVIVGFIAFLSACATGRSEQRRDPAELLASADTNKDGVVTRAEFLAARAAAFSKYDRNGDGFVDAADFPSRLRARRNAGQRLEALVDYFDTDGDKRISRAEFVDGPTLVFDRADSDHDGQLSKAEIAALRGRGAG